MMNRRSVSAAALAGAILLQLATVRVFLSADAGGVTFAGSRYADACFLQRYAGIPCPTCGMTRSVVLTLHGDLGPALRINPAGPLWVLAALTVSAALLYFAWRPGERAKRRMVSLALAQGLAVAVVLAGHWVRAVLVR
jgi:Protein of unknown function (DUF2752)